MCPKVLISLLMQLVPNGLNIDMKYSCYIRFDLSDYQITEALEWLDDNVGRSKWKLCVLSHFAFETYDDMILFKLTFPHLTSSEKTDMLHM